MKEEWKDILGYEGSYQVSNQGVVRSLTRTIHTSNNKEYEERGVIKSQRLNPDGYPRVTLSKGSVKKNHSVARLVAEHFIPNPENKEQVNHISGTKTDNRIENLEWCTIQENIRHSNETGLAKVVSGENHIWAVLKDIEVIDIYKRANKGEPQKQIAEEYSTSISVVSRIKNSVRWNRLTKEIQI